MINYGKTQINQYETLTDYDDLGERTFKDFQSIPFYGVVYNNHELQRESMGNCNETYGDCWKMVNQYLEFKWE